MMKSRVRLAESVGFRWITSKSYFNAMAPRTSVTRLGISIQEYSLGKGEPQ